MAAEAIEAPDQRRLSARFWQSATGFWRGRSAFQGWFFSIALVVIVLAQLLSQYLINVWNRDFFDAFGHRDADQLWAAILRFVPLVALSVALAVTSLWGRMTMQRRWRDWLSRHIIDYWIADENFRRLSTLPGAHRYPEYRIAEDVRGAVEPPIDMATGFLNSVLTAITFVSVLWTVGGTLVIERAGADIVIPGYLVVAAVLHSILFTLATALFGRRLTAVIEDKNQAEANLRANASDLREAGEALPQAIVPPSDGRRVILALGEVIEQWRALCGQLMRITVVGHTNFIIAPIMGWIICTPKYLAGQMSLGEAAQAAAAFVIVQGAFNWFADNFQRLSDWTSSANRVAALLLALDEIESRDNSPAAEPAAAPAEGVQLVASASSQLDN